MFKTNTCKKHATAHCRQCPRLILVKNILQLVQRKGKIGPKHFLRTNGWDKYQGSQFKFHGTKSKDKFGMEGGYAKLIK